MYFCVSFQYISCYCLSISIEASSTDITISIHLMLLFIFKTCSSGCVCCISIHLMLLFILKQKNKISGMKNFNTSHVTVYLPVFALQFLNVEFQYISCYCLSLVKALKSGAKKDFNTSHVTVYLTS